MCQGNAQYMTLRYKEENVWCTAFAERAESRP